MSFIDDIQGKNTQLYPLVVIEYGGDMDSSIFISTNNTMVDDIYFTPLLLNIPSIKESIDIESRKFKISNVNLDISNHEYNGKRFTDILNETSLINTTVSIFIKSPSTTSVTPTFDGDPSEDGCPRIYVGTIRRIAHDDEKARVELEDLTEKQLHRDLPSVSANIEVNENIPSKYHNAPHPMVYGHVDKSPLAITDYDPNTGEGIISADYRGIDNILADDSIHNDTVNTLRIFSEGEYLHVLKTSVNYSEWGYLVGDQYTNNSQEFNIKSRVGGVDYGGQAQDTISPLNDNKCEVSLYQKPTSYKLYTDVDSYEGVDHPIQPEGHYTYYNADNIDDIVEISKQYYVSYQGEDDVVHYNRYELSYNFDYSPKSQLEDFKKTLYYDVKSTISEMSLIPNVSTQGISCRLIQNHNVHQEYDFLIPDNLIQYLFEFISSDLIFSDSSDLQELDMTDTSCNSNFIFQIYFASIDWAVWDYPAESEGGSCNNKFEVNTIYQKTNFLYDGFIESDFYANVRGRITQDFMQDHLLENPIDIMRDLVKYELGHDVDVLSWGHSRDNHSGWKFAFTVNKKNQF